MPVYTCPHCQCRIEPSKVLRRRGCARDDSRRTPHPPRSPLDRVWQCMRQLRRFTHHDLVAAAESPLLATTYYVNCLVKVGYVRVVGNPRGEPGSYKQFLLLKDTGPHAPRWIKTRRCVFDANLDREVTCVAAQ